MNVDEAVRLIRSRWPAAKSTAVDQPVFVLAAGWRSGSTMLQRMLLGNCMVWGEPFGSSGIVERLSQPLQRFASDWPLDHFFLDSPKWSGRLSDQWTANMYPSVQNLLDAHIAFFRTLLAESAREIGYARWGLKEVRYGIEHAIYLRWLFPNAKFLLLIRNPYECWASYRRAHSQVLRFWPEKLITEPEEFGNHWKSLATGFWDRSNEIDAMKLRYEAVIRPDFDFSAVEEHVGFELEKSARKILVGASPPGNVSTDEMVRLESAIEPLATRLGYLNPSRQRRESE